MRMVVWLSLALAAALLSGCVSITRRGDETAAPSGALPTSSWALGASPSSWPSDEPAGPAGSRAPGVALSAAPSASPLPSLRPGQRRIGYLSLDEGTAFVAAASASIRASVAEAGLQLVECDGGWTREGVLACIERLAASETEGLLSFQPFPDLAPQICEAFGGLPVVGIVFDQGSCQVSRLRIDQAESGRLAGAAVGRFASQRWDCDASAFLSLESSDADPDGRARMAGYRAGYQEHCPLPGRTFVLDGADRPATAQSQVARRLEGLQGKRIIVVGLNEDAIRGAMAAAAAAGREGEVWYSGQLADPAMRRTIACDAQYIASVAQFPERFGEQLVPLLARVMEGETVPPLVDAPLQLVTSANVRQLFPDTPACPE
jgi:ribose transport system substrate-binding protein